MKKIYIIDDDKDIVEAISMVLESQDYKVGHQLNQESFVENVISFNPDLIIMDVMFPENANAGFEMSRELKKHDQTENIPILMLSAVNEQGEYVRSFSNRDRDDMYLPVDEFVEKPMQPDKLLQKVAELIS